MKMYRALFCFLKDCCYFCKKEYGETQDISN